MPHRNFLSFESSIKDNNKQLENRKAAVFLRKIQADKKDSVLWSNWDISTLTYTWMSGWDWSDHEAGLSVAPQAAWLPSPSFSLLLNFRALRLTVHRWRINHFISRISGFVFIRRMHEYKQNLAKLLKFRIVAFEILLCSRDLFKQRLKSNVHFSWNVNERFLTPRY